MGRVGMGPNTESPQQARAPRTRPRLLIAGAVLVLVGLALAFLSLPFVTLMGFGGLVVGLAMLVGGVLVVGTGIAVARETRGAIALARVLALSGLVLALIGVAGRLVEGYRTWVRAPQFGIDVLLETISDLIPLALLVLVLIGVLGALRAPAIDSKAAPEN